MDLLTAVYKIDDVRHDQVSVWDQQLNRQTIQISVPESLPKQRSLQSMHESSGQTYNRTVVIFKDVVLDFVKDRVENLDAIKEVVESFGKISAKNYPDILERLQQQGDDTKKLALVLAFANLVNRSRGQYDSPEIERENTIAHESGHALDYDKESFRQRWVPKATSSMRENLAYNANYMAHDEIDGMLAELRYSPSKAVALLGTLSTKIGDKSTDFGHVAAAEWIVKHILEDIKTRPEALGIIIKPKSRVTVDDQIISQFPTLLDHMEAYDQILEKLYKYHQNHFDEDFSAEYLESLNFVKKPETGNNIKKIAITVAEILGPLAAAGYGLKLLLDRKNKIAKEAKASAGKNSPKKSPKNRQRK